MLSKDAVEVLVEVYRLGDVTESFTINVLLGAD